MIRKDGNSSPISLLVIVANISSGACVGAVKYQGSLEQFLWWLYCDLGYCLKTLFVKDNMSSYTHLL